MTNLNEVFPAATGRSAPTLAPAVGFFNVSPAAASDRSSPVQPATARPSESGGGSLEGTFAVGRDETVPLVVVALVSNPASSGIAALSGVSPGNATAVGSFRGTVVSQDGRAVFDGDAAGPLASDLALMIPGRPSAEASPAELVPFDVTRKNGQNSGADESFETLVSDRHDVPSPERSHLLTDLRLFDRTSLEHAIDAFLNESENLGAGLSWMVAPGYLLTELMAATVALTSAKVVIKVLGRSASDEADLARSDDDESFDRFSGLLGP